MSANMKVVTLGLVGFTALCFVADNLLTAAAVISILPILIIFLTLQKLAARAVV